MTQENRRMSGKLCLVTGATSGIGAATALALARAGGTVVGVGRNAKRCARSCERIVRETGNGKVSFLRADLSVQGEVRELAREVQSCHPRLDLLVNCAGARFDARELSADGIEMTFALNHLSCFLLTLLLFEKLADAGRARVVNVSSAAHRGVPALDFDDLQGERGYCGRRAYASSKLANLLFTCELNRRLAGTGVAVNAAAPGNVLSRFALNNGVLGFARHLAGSLKSGSLVGARKGAQTVIFLASSPQVEGLTGGYFAAGGPARPSDAALDAAAAIRLWEASLEVTRLRPSRLLGDLT